MDNAFYRQIHNNNNMSEAQVAITLLTIAVVYLVYTEVNEKK